MSKIIRITDTVTGEVRDYIEEHWNENSGEFLWKEGNYSCDCNRALFFAWAAGEERDSFDSDLSCGLTRFEVELI